MQRITMAMVAFFIGLALLPGPAYAEPIRDLKAHGKWKHLTQYIATSEIAAVLGDPEVDAVLRRYAKEYYPWFGRMKNWGYVSMSSFETLELTGGAYFKEREEKVHCILLVHWDPGYVEFAFRGNGWAVFYSPMSIYRQVDSRVLEFIQWHKVANIVTEEPTDIDVKRIRPR